MENLQDILDKRSAPGLLLFDLQGRLLYFSQKTQEIIPILQKAPSHSSKKGAFWPPALSQLLHEVIGHAKQPKTLRSNKTSFHRLLFNSDMAYSLRAFLLGPEYKKVNPSHILILAEPIITNRVMDMGNLKEKFNLTKREIEVVKLICAGFSNKIIAEKLFVSEYTVKDHLKHIMEKMGADSRNQIIATLLNLS